MISCRPATSEALEARSLEGTRWCSYGEQEGTRAAEEDGLQLQFSSATEGSIAQHTERSEPLLGKVFAESNDLSLPLSYRYNYVLKYYELDFNTGVRIHRLAAHVDWAQQTLLLCEPGDKKGSDTIRFALIAQ